MEEIIKKDEMELSISVVSHLQLKLIEKLLHDIDRQCHRSLEVLLTLNLDEPLPFDPEGFSFPITVIRNQVAQGFSANHDQAFTYAKGRYFCVINPDIRLNEDPFLALISCLQEPSVGVVAPLVTNSDGEIEDSARKFPSPLKILCKAFGKCKGDDYVVKNENISPDWVGGMFMVFRREVFEQLGGFDRKFFLYYEDVDLCARIRLRGYEVVLTPSAKVIHEARRDSHRKIKFLRWHLTSMLRFFLSPVYWRLQFHR